MALNSLRIGVVGTGMMGRSHIERINNRLTGAHVVACSDINKKFGRKIARLYGCEFFEDGIKMIEDDGVDAVIVSTHDWAHEEYVMSALGKGKYVFCEKPLAHDADVCRRIVEAEMFGEKRLIQVGFMRRYDAGFNQLKEAVKSRIYGEPLLLHCAHRTASVPDDYKTSMEVETSLIHEIDAIRWLLDEEYESVEVAYGKRTRNACSGLIDPQVMVLTTKSGVRADVEGFVCTGNCYHVKCEVVCEDAILNLPEINTIQVLEKATRSNAVDIDWSTRFDGAYNREIQEWINAVKSDRIIGPNAWDGYVDQLVAKAATKSREENHAVILENEEKPDFYK